jgi:putative protease
MKSAEYVGTVVSAYRRVIDALGSGSEGRAIEEGRAIDEGRAIKEGLAILRNDFARTKTLFCIDYGIDRDDQEPESVDWLNPAQSGGTGIPLGAILAVKAGLGLVAADRIKPEPGDSIRLHRSDDTERQSHKLSFVGECADEEQDAGRQDSRQQDGRPELKRYWISIPEGFGIGDEVYLIQTKTMSKRYTPLLPNRTGSSRSPGHERAPHISLPPEDKAQAKLNERRLPRGLYVAVSCIEDLYVVQSARPEKVMLSYTSKTVAHILGNKGPLPFKPAELILVLDPYFPQASEEKYAREIPELLSRGYDCFVLNNPGHFSYFRDTDCSLIAGPYLYVFNRWAASFVSGLTARFISPLENNRQNLERTLDPPRRSRCFVPVFAYPALFRIRADLSRVYDFGAFSDRRNERFSLFSSRDGSVVIPEKPFSIVDKIPFLEAAGFSRFVLDLCGPPLRKLDYKDLMRAVKSVVPLPNVVRFNWKNGFYAVPESSHSESLHSQSSHFESSHKEE